MVFVYHFNFYGLYSIPIFHVFHVFHDEKTNFNSHWWLIIIFFFWSKEKNFKNYNPNPFPHVFFSFAFFIFSDGYVTVRYKTRRGDNQLLYFYISLFLFLSISINGITFFFIRVHNMQKRSISNPSTMPFLYCILVNPFLVVAHMRAHEWGKKRNMWNCSTCIRIRICANSLHERNLTVPLNQICVTQDRNEFAHNMKIYSNINVCVSPTNDINKFFFLLVVLSRWKRGRGTLFIRFFQLSLCLESISHTNMGNHVKYYFYTLLTFI